MRSAAALSSVLFGDILQGNHQGSRAPKLFDKRGMLGIDCADTIDDRGVLTLSVERKSTPRDLYQATVIAKLLEWAEHPVQNLQLRDSMTVSRWHSRCLCQGNKGLICREIFLSMQRSIAGSRFFSLRGDRLAHRSRQERCSLQLYVCSARCAYVRDLCAERRVPIVSNHRGRTLA
jgi:hypothetical protein